MNSPKRHEERPGELQLDLPAAHSAGRMGRQMVRRFALTEGMPESEVDTLEFVTSELLSNAVDHGGGNHAMEESDLEGDVRMALLLSIREGTWELRVTDQGEGTLQEVEALMGRDGLPDLEDERGRGFFLLSQMVDVLDVDDGVEGWGLTFIARKVWDDGSI